MQASPQPLDDDPQWPVTRRTVFQTGAALAAVQAAGGAVAQGSQPAASDAPARRDLPPQRMPVELHINGKTHTLTVDTRTTLLDALRENLRMTGQERLRPRPVRRLQCWSKAGAPTPASALP
ncbi:MAG: hypothetical protein WKG52_04220 [Variovorax sp.]